MKKVKTHHLVWFVLIAQFSMTGLPPLYGQNILSRERENEIKMSGNYYWGEGSDFVEELAKLSASVELSNQIIKDAVGQSEQLDEILKAIEMSANLDQLPQQGKIKILAWIAKESVMLTVSITTQRPITLMYDPPPVSSNPVQDKIIETERNIVTEPEPVRTPTMNIAITNNPILQEIAACKTYNEVKRVATMHGVVRGVIGGGSKGFLHPEDCIIAVFTADGTLEALLDTGGSSRTDVLSGNTIDHPDQYYNWGDYYLWYMQQKTVVRNEVDNVPNDYSSVNSSINSSIQAPPIENTKDPWMWNAVIRLPKTGSGKSVLANGFVFIDRNDIALQNRYNVHPGQRSPKDGHIFFDDEDCYNDSCWREIWDEDEHFYEYPLSPDIVIEADVYGARRRMSFAEFADYYRQNPYYSQIDDDTGEEKGMIVNITYIDGVVTKIIETYLP